MIAGCMLTAGCMHHTSCYAVQETCTVVERRSQVRSIRSLEMLSKLQYMSESHATLTRMACVLEYNV